MVSIQDKTGSDDLEGKNRHGRLRFEEAKDTSSLKFQEATKIYTTSIPESENRSVSSLEASILSL